VFHRLIDPERDVPPESTKVHGFTAEMLRGKPRFAEIAADLVAFLGDAPIIAHNAPFDFGFLDAELSRAGLAALDRARMIDSLEIARKRFPGLPNNLDALCRRFGIDNTMRTSHNAVLDTQLLAQVYLELMGGRQPGLSLTARPVRSAVPGVGTQQAAPVARTPRPIVPTEAELAAHRAFVGRLKDPLWLQPPFADAAPEDAAAG
ncbi:MAG: DNA polymerase III subunit epsilon, partial [Acetobacteraceae bacterium]|nr:DNA polymerase III subunit epsilon [Acetobacteraceae bacterium]